MSVIYETQGTAAVLGHRLDEYVVDRNVKVNYISIQLLLVSTATALLGRMIENETLLPKANSVSSAVTS